MASMNYPAPMPTSERLPNRANGGAAPYSDEVLIFTGGDWAVGSFQYDNETGNEGSWCVYGEVIPADEVSHWMPKPPNPPQAG